MTGACSFFERMLMIWVVLASLLPVTAFAQLGDPVLTPPELVQEVQPTYPPGANLAGVSATIVLDIDIDTEGNVENVVVTSGTSKSEYAFDAAAVAAAWQLVFRPARLGEVPVSVTLSYRFRFVPRLVEPAGPPNMPINASSESPPGLGQLWGNLSERGTRRPLVGARVTIFRTNGDGKDRASAGFDIETDSNGDFRFEDLPPGTWEIWAEPDGYYTLRGSEEVSADVRTTLRYRIEKRSYNSYDVVIQTKKVSRQLSQTSLDAKRADRIPGSFGDVLAVVQNFPGVARSNFSEVVARGSSPEDSKYYVNGIGVPIIYHFVGLRSVLPVGMVERVDFYPGNFSVKFGRATGSIVDVDLRDLQPEQFSGYVDISILDTSVYLQTPISDTLSVAVAARRSYIDFLLDLLVDDETFRLTKASRYYDAQILVNYRPSSSHRFELFLLYSNDQVGVVRDDDELQPDIINVNSIDYGLAFSHAIAAYKYVPSTSFSNEVQITLGHNDTRFSLGPQVFGMIEGHEIQLRNTTRLSVSDTLTFEAGVDHLSQYNTYSVRLPLLPLEGEEFLEYDEQDLVFSEAKGYIHSSAVFLQAEYQPHKAVLIVPGLRFDHFSRTQTTSISGRITAQANVLDSLTLKTGVGLFTQEPEFSETDPKFGNANLGLERAIHYAIGVSYHPEDLLKLEVTGFYKTLGQLVTRTKDIQVVDGELQPALLANHGRGRVIGLEFSGEYSPNDQLSTQVAYTLSRAERKDEGEAGYRLFDYDQTHILTLLATYQLPRNWEVIGRFRLVTGNLHTPVIGSVYDSDKDIFLPIRGEKNSARLSTFNQIDFRINKRIVYDTWVLNAYLDIQNIMDRNNPNEVEYNFDYSEPLNESTGLPILPIIGVRGEF